MGRTACGLPRPDLLTVRYADGTCLPMLSPNTPDPCAFRLGRAPDPPPG